MLHGAPYAGLTTSAHALAAAPDDGAAAHLLAGILTGERICALGLAGPDARVARLIDGAARADALLLVDRYSSALTLFPDRHGWSAEPARDDFDVSRTCSTVTVDRGEGHRLATDGRAFGLYRLLLAADAVGCVQTVLDRTVAYSAQRHAFGRPIGGFQAVQHRLVDHTVRARGMALAVAEAARSLSSEDGPRAARSVAVAGVSVNSAATHIIHDLLQLTGAIGFTWEYGLHFHERRAHQDARLAGNPRAALRSLAELEEWTRAR